MLTQRTLQDGSFEGDPVLAALLQLLDTEKSKASHGTCTISEHLLLTPQLTGLLAGCADCSAQRAACVSGLTGCHSAAHAGPQRRGKLPSAAHTWTRALADSGSVRRCDERAMASWPTSTLWTC